MKYKKNGKTNAKIRILTLKKSKLINHFFGIIV